MQKSLPNVNTEFNEFFQLYLIFKKYCLTYTRKLKFSYNEDIYTFILSSLFSALCKEDELGS